MAAFIIDQEYSVDVFLRELECVQQKVIRWNSSGRFKRAFLAHDHAEELKGHQDTVQNALEEMQARLDLLSAI